MVAVIVQAAVRETMVLPNSESVCIPWMLAEKDDWIPQKSAPFVWINQEAVTDPTNVHQRPSSQPSEETRVHEAVDIHTSSYPEGKQANEKKEVTSVLEAVKINTSSYPEVKQAKEKKEVTSELLDDLASAYSPMNQLTLNENPLQELRTPLLENDEQQQLASRWIKEDNRDGQSAVSQSPSLSRSLILPEEQSDTMEGNDAKPKRIGTRARMLGLGKKVGEKLEEKRRNIEERSRSMVDRVRGP